MIVPKNGESISKKISFLFTGNIGLVQDVETIIYAVSEINPDLNFKVDIVGDGSNLEVCKVLVKEKKIENKIIFHGRHPYKDMPEFYAKADICLLTLKNENKIGLTIPAKLQGYMAAGKPVLAAIDGDAKEIIEEANCGICLHSGDYISLAKAMEKLITDPEKNKEYSTNAKRYYEKHFTKSKFISKTLSVFVDVLKN